jgi:GT2 family glycosyltransferase
VIVVDDGSRAPVAPPAVALGASRALLVLRNEEAMGPAASRNRGLEAGEAPVVVFLDDDVIAHPELLARHRDVFVRRPGPVVSIGSLRPPPGARLPPWDRWQADRLAREEGRLARGEADASWTHLYSGNVAVRRVELQAVGGFDPLFARQEDVELGYRLSRVGCRFVFEPTAVVWHDARHSLADWLRIPAASAAYDELIDRLRPESGRLRAVRDELAGRHWLLRAARRALVATALDRPAEYLAIAAGRILHRAGAGRVGLLAFSLVWDLEYHRALRGAHDPRRERGAAGGSGGAAATPRPRTP